MDYLGYVVKKILLTGAQGFLGRNICESLRMQGFQVFATGRNLEHKIYRCDLTSYFDTVRMTADINPDIVIHCASFVPTSFSEYNDSLSSKLNILMLKNIVNATTCPLLFISSMTIYSSDDRSYPVKEEEGVCPQTAYAQSKWDCELYLQSLQRQTLSVRIPGLFGPSRTSGLVFNTLRSLKLGKKLVLPDQPLMWAAMHVDDIVISITKLINCNWLKYRSINCGYAGPSSINKLLNIAQDCLNLRIESLTDIRHPIFEFDLSKARQLNIEPSTSLHDSILKLIPYV